MELWCGWYFGYSYAKFEPASTAAGLFYISKVYPIRVLAKLKTITIVKKHFLVGVSDNLFNIDGIGIYQIFT